MTWLWPALVLCFLPLGVGVAVGVIVDGVLGLRDLRRARDLSESRDRIDSTA